MKRLLAVVCLVGLVWLLPPADTRADGWSPSYSKRQTKPSGISKTLKEIDAGTKKFLRGTIDVITLKPLRQRNRPYLAPPEKPWLNNSSKKKEKKKSFWSSLFKPDKKPKRVESMKDFVGLERPGSRR